MLSINLQSLSVQASWALAFVLISSGIAKIVAPSKTSFFKNRHVENLKSALKYFEILIGFTILTFRQIGLTFSFLLFCIYLFVALVAFVNKYKKPCNCLGSITNKAINIFSIIALIWLISLNLLAFTHPRGEPGIIGIALYLGSIVLMIL